MSDATSDKDFRTKDDKAAADAGRSADEQVTGRSDGPIDADDMEAAEGLTASPETAEAYEEMVERGAKQKGEGAPEV
jgi:hypothetical protein